MTAKERAIFLYSLVAEDEQLREQGDTPMDLRGLFAREVHAAEQAAYERAAGVAETLRVSPPSPMDVWKRSEAVQIATAIRALASEETA